MKKLHALVFVSLVWIATLNQSSAAPSWMGVYGEHVTHDGGNPGTFTILMNQDYWGLHAELGYRVNGGAWSTLPMHYVGNVDGNSKWKVTPNAAFPSHATVEFYFHGWDLWGGHVWDSNWGANYQQTLGGAELYWFGNLTQSPSNGSINLDDEITISLESWPRSGTHQGSIVYSMNGNGFWYLSPLTHAGQTGQNDTWSANLGSFQWNTLLQYAAFLDDGNQTTHWDNNGGQDYFTRINRNPILSAQGDIDGDGIPNGVEYDLNMDPENAVDGRRDSDGDGLSNSAEYTAGTSPSIADSDGDGASDYLEVIGTKTDPNTPQAHSFLRTVSANLYTPTAIAGDWSPTSTGQSCQGVRGSLSYSLNVPSGDFYLVELEVSQTIASSTARIFIDGEEIGHTALPESETATSVYILGSYLDSGTHELSFLWDNTHGHNDLTLHHLSLVRLTGSDENANSLADWADNIILDRNTFQVLPETSYVSPAFIEGKCGHIGQASINSGAIPAKPAAGGWYANIPLAESSATPVTVSLENGSLSQTAQIEWKSFNLYENNHLTIRQGDALRLVAHDPTNSAVLPTQYISINGGAEVSCSASQPYQHTFSQAGTYTISGRYQTGVHQWHTANATVQVVSANLNDTIAVCRAETHRSWTAGEMGSHSVLSQDPNLYLQNVALDSTGQPTFNLATDRFKARYLEARAGTHHGSILDTAETSMVAVYGANYTWQTVLETLPDGTERTEIGVIMYPLREDIQIKMKTLPAGVSFEDGTIEKWLNHSDFDETGVTSVVLLRPANATTAPCHAFEVYQNQTKISY